MLSYAIKLFRFGQFITIVISPENEKTIGNNGLQHQALERT